MSDTKSIAANKHLLGVDNFIGFADGLAASSGGVEDAVKAGWAITALFYSSVHALRAWLVIRHGHQIVSHDDMKNAFRDHPELQKSKRDYEDLKQQSQAARYYLNDRFTWADVAAMRAKSMRIRSAWFDKTKAEIASVATVR